MTPRELRLLIAVAFLIGAAWWFISLTNACMTWLKILPKGSCISAFSLNFGATTFWFYNLLAVLALYAAFHLYKTLPSEDPKPERRQYKEPQGEVVADLANANYKVHLIDKYRIFKNDVLGQYVCDNKLFETVDAALEHAHKLNQESLNNSDTFDDVSKSATSSEPPSRDGRDCQDRKYQKELERYNISFDVLTQRYIFQNQRYFDAETAVLAAQADEQRAKSRELELSELAKHGIQFDATADRYIYQGRRYMEAKEALDAAAIEDVNKQGVPRFNDDVKDEPIATENTTQEPILRSKRFFLGVAVGGVAGATSAWFSYEPIKYPAAKTLAQRPNSISLSKPTVPFEKRTADSIIFAFATQGVYYEEGQHYPATMPRTRINVSLTIYSDGYADFSVDNLKGEVVSRSYAYFGTGKDGEKNTYLVFRSLQDPEMILAYNFKEDTLASVNKRTTKGVWVKFESNTFYDRN